MSDLPTGWTMKESKSHPGRMYYINQVTGETTWTKPTSPVENNEQQVQVFHILKKHNKSRRPASWRNPNITQSIDEARSQVEAIRRELQHLLENEGFDAMFKRFREIAFQESDCGSHDRGGDLGLFGRGQMQRPFEDASYSLKPGQLSGLVETDSGVHVLLRVV